MLNDATKRYLLLVGTTTLINAGAALSGSDIGWVACFGITSFINYWTATKYLGVDPKTLSDQNNASAIGLTGLLLAGLTPCASDFLSRSTAYLGCSLGIGVLFTGFALSVTEFGRKKFVDNFLGEASRPVDQLARAQ